MDCMVYERCCFQPCREKEECPNTCKPPQKLHGLDVEIALRKAPYLGYPPKSVQPYGFKQQPWVYRRELPPVKCTPRHFIKRIYETLTQTEEVKGVAPGVWQLWLSYEREAADVFVYSNVDVVANLLLVLSISCHHFQTWQVIFDRMIQRLQKGLYLSDASKELRDIKRLTYFFSCLGVAIADGHSHAQKCVSNVISLWLEKLVRKGRVHPRRNRCHPAPVGSKFLKLRVPNYILITALEKSFLPITVAKCINKAMPMDSYLYILDLLKLCCEASSAIRERLWCFPILNYVLSTLSLPDPSNRILVKSVDFAYSYFGVYSMYKNDDRTAELLPKIGRDAFQSLVHRFIQQTEYSMSLTKSFVSVRNDMAFLICLICKRIPFAGEYFFGDYGAIIASMVSNGIFGKKRLDSAFSIDNTPQDLELLQFLISMLQYIVEVGSGDRLIRKYNLVSALFTLLLGQCSISIENVGPAVGTNLQNAAWSTIHSIAEYFPLFLLSQHGASSLLTTLAVFGSTGDGDEALLATALNTLRTMMTAAFWKDEEESEIENTMSDEVIIYLIERDAVVIFLSVLNRLALGSLGSLHETMISNTLYCIAKLLRCDVNQKETFVKFDGISKLTMLMRQLIATNYKERKILDPVIQKALSDCVCQCVAYYPPALENFLDNQGVLRLLDILEMATCPDAIVHLTNCLNQVCDYPRCLQQMLCWKRPLRNITQDYVFGDWVDPMARSMLITKKQPPKSGDCLTELDNSKDLSLGAFLCYLWEKQEKKTGVLRDPEGCIEKLSQPLMTKTAREVDGIAEKAVVDMSNTSLRPKIYLIIKHILEMTNTAATLFDGLSQINQIILQVIINFMDLKKSEVFTDWGDEIKRLELSFAPSDQGEVENTIIMANNKVETVLATQRLLLGRCKEKETIKETEFYSLIKLCQLQDHLKAVREVNYFAKTINYQYLVERRLWQKKELQDSLNNVDKSVLQWTRVHRTWDNYLNVTSWAIRARNLAAEADVNAEFYGLLPNEYEENNGEEILSENEEEPVPKPAAEESLLDLFSIRQPSNMSQLTVNASLTWNQSRSSMLVDVKETPAFEGGYYQVSPYMLHEALTRLQTVQRRDAWFQLVDKDEENQWKVYKKWRQDWYPLARLREEKKEEKDEDPQEKKNEFEDEEEMDEYFN